MRTRIKFCGLVRPDDVRTAVALGVDAIGFVFYPKSPRFLELAEAAALRRLLPSYVTAVGLFVGGSGETIARTAQAAGLDVIQFHGDEPREQCERDLPPGLAYWRAVRVRNQADLLESFACFGRGSQGAVPGAEALLLDSFSAGYGGSGASFDWNWIPAQPALPIVLSGGLTPESVGAAVRCVRPMMVDVSSGIQAAEPPDPRAKSRQRMERFVAEVLRADALIQDENEAVRSS
ncbi:MAG: phosphoribosylanthranilate isomerase [Burkholderiales bacterium]|nr:phosphoribosylanthranilate isomerase [Burkholderiales bacterium]